MSETYQHIYVSAGDISNSPFYDFYTDSSGTQELTPSNTLYLDASYVFHRLEEATSHPFYISDVSYEQPHSSNIRLTGDGSYNTGITGSETLTLEFTGLDTSDNLYYYCTAHSNMVNTFTLVETTPIVDNTAPTLSSISPILNATNVDINSDLIFTFSEDVSGSTGNITIYDNSDNVVEIIDVSGENVSILNNEVTVNPVSNLSYNTSYYVNIDAGALEDGAGNAFTGLDSSSNSGMRFTTVPDTLGPTIDFIQPSLNSIDVAINDNLEFTFNENITDGSGNITIYDNSTNAIVESIDISSSFVTIFENQLIIDPSFDLSYSTTYYVNIDAGALEDGAGNAFTGLDSSSNSGMRFTTQDEPDIIPPTLVSFSPILNATDISANTELVFTFDENMQTNGDGNITIYDASTNDVIQEINSLSDNISISGEIITVSILNDLSYNTSYYVNIDSNILTDETNNFFAGLDSSSNSGMRFTTEVDAYSPILSSVTPVLNATDVLIDTTLVFNFNEDISANSGNITLYDASNNLALQVFDVSSSDVSISGNQATITLQTDLSFDTSYYVNIDSGAFEDSVGNAFTGLDSSSNSGMRFTTASDYIGPVITDISPLLNAIDVSINSNLEFNFNEDISANSGNITILDASTNTIIQTIDVSSSSLDISGNRATITLQTDLSFDTFYYVNIDEGAFQDIFGNDFAGLDSSSNSGMRFTTASDYIGPVITDISPLLNATDISINTNLEFNFNEDISVNSGNITILDASTNTIIQTIDVSSTSLDISGNRATITLQTDLSFDTSYYVNIDSGAFEDSVGNDFTGLDSSSNSGMRFTTASDYIGPVITDISPLLNAIDVSINSNLEFTFDEVISDGSGNITILDASTNTIIQTIDVSSTSVDISGNRAIVTLSTNLPYITPLYVNIDEGAFQDIFGNDFAGLNSSVVDTGMRFSTELDKEPPTLVSVSPILNATDISINSNLVFTFSENMVDASGNIYLYDSSTNELLNTFDVTSANISISGSQVTLNPSTDLSFNRSLYVNIDSGAFEDEVGNIYTGLDSSGADTGMRFTTERDVTIPTITNISPGLNATNVPISTNLTFTFSETIVDGSGSILVYRSSNDTLIRSFDVSSSEVTIAGNEVVIVNPSVDLSYNTLFYVNIDAGAFKDLRDNDFAGLDSSSPDTGMRFTTELDTIKPTITSISPLLDATDVSLNSNIEVTFSEDVVIGSGNITIHRSSNDIILQIIDVTDSNVTLNRNQVIINPDRDLPVELSLYVNIDSGAFKDLRGNDFAGLDSSSLNTGIRFTTIDSETDPDIISPTLSSISPILNATGVRLDTLLVFTFSEEPILDVTGSITIHNSMDNTIIQTLDITGYHVTITGKQVVARPPIYLPPNTGIYVNISSNALLDSAGNNFGGLDSSTSDTGMRFTTIDPTTTRLFDIVRFCQDKKCQQNIDYKRLKTGGNDPSMSSSMRYAQYVRGNGSRR